MKRAARLLGMRGDTTREIREFASIIVRHACREDREEFLRLMRGDGVDGMKAPELLVALVRRSPGFDEEFAAAEKRRYDRNDRPRLEAFQKRVQAIVEEALQIRDTAYSIEVIKKLRELEAHIPGPCPWPGFGPQWREDGLKVLDDAIKRVKAGISQSNVASMLALVGPLVAEIHATVKTEKARRSEAARKRGRKGGLRRRDGSIPHVEIMRAIERRVKAGHLIKTAVRETMEFFADKGQPIDCKPDTLRKQYGTYRGQRTD